MLQFKGLPAAALYDLARVHALSAAAIKDEKTAAKAVELLRQAAAMGFNEIEVVKKEADFDSLRQRPDFRTLIEELPRKPADK